MTLSGVRFAPKFPSYKKIVAEREVRGWPRLTFTADQFVNRAATDAPLPASLAGIPAGSLLTKWASFMLRK